MKKLLGILVLGLLLSSKAYAENIYLNCSRIITENNGDGEWSSFYEVGSGLLGDIYVQIEKKNSSAKIKVHLQENDSGEPEKLFKGKGSYESGHYKMNKKHNGKVFINTWFLKDYGVTKMNAKDQLDIFKSENKWIIKGTTIRKYKNHINVNLNYDGKCNTLTAENYTNGIKK